MAQDTQPPTGDQHETEARGRDSKFHYYAGGEIKEQAGTNIGPYLYIPFILLVIAALFYFFYGGGLASNGGANSSFKPVGGSMASLNDIEQKLLARRAAEGIAPLGTVDMAALPLPPGQNLNQAISKGQDLYQTYCIGCHGPNQDGNGVGAGSLNPKPRNLHDAPFMQAMSYQRITTSIHKGVPGTAMPRWENTLSDSDIQDLIAYVFSLTAPTAPVAPAAAPAGPAPTPITPSVGGNPAAQTSTSPPSIQTQAGPPTAPTAGGAPTAPNPDAGNGKL